MCVVDTFGTIVDWRGSVINEVAQLARQKGWDLDAAAFADAWRRNYGPSRNRVRNGELPWTKLDDLHRMTLDELLVTFQIEELSEEEKVDLNRVWHRLHAWPDAPSALARLKTRYVLSPTLKWKRGSSDKHGQVCRYSLGLRSRIRCRSALQTGP